MHTEALNLREVIIFLIAAGIAVPLVQRMRISPVLGFLIAGLVIGPFGIAQFSEQFPLLRYAVIDDLEGTRALAEFGVVFLLFMIGLELSFDRLWAMRRLVFGLGGAQVLVTGAVIAVIAGMFGSLPVTAVILGAAFALSSTAIVMQLLAQNRRLGTATGSVSFAILLFQDLAVLPILFMTAAFGAKTDGSALGAFAWALAQAFSAVVLIFAIGRVIMRPLFRIVGATASRELFLALVLLIIVGTALATELAGLSMALGAFLAGLLLAETEYRHQIEIDIEPFKGLLLGLFFVSVGMSIDISRVIVEPLWLIGSVIGLYCVKVPIIYILVRLFREPRAVAAESALLLGQGGEFAFIIVGMALTMALVPNDVAQFMLIVASLTMLVTPLMANVARNLAQFIEARDAQHGQSEPGIPADLANHVIVVGYGRVGQMLGAVLGEQEIAHVGLDGDANLVGQFRATGASVYFGDASRPELLGKFAADTAAALVVTMDSPYAVERIVEAAHKHWPQLVIYARARDVVHARRLISKGASHAIPETMEASLQLGEMVLVGAGIPANAARQTIDVRRQAVQLAVDEDHGKSQ